ncbi:type VI secretion system (T6SS) tail sheath-like EvpB-like protein [Sphingomonas sp. PP-F2F-A104-K0414]|nr:type VI secretion system contractile sheath large subunit [Sphingomonas sp. PP-F2F-A104-K0414]TCQ01013.1 type VI secretion system (T6SS) tail sheath-like EvpB-like protein [Sphingomonas sp. PP-F2F-A104-K0414]
MASNPNLATELQTGTAEDLSIDDFSALLQKEFKPKSDEAKSRVEMAVRTLAEQALAGSTIVSTDVLGTIESMISSIDRKLSEQVNLVLHHPDFQALESAWRGRLDSGGPIHPVRHTARQRYAEGFDADDIGGIDEKTTTSFSHAGRNSSVGGGAGGHTRSVLASADDQIGVAT